MLTRLFVACGLVFLWGLGRPADAQPSTRADPPPTLVVFAAASLVDALDEVDRKFTVQTHYQVKTSYAASSILAKQIEAGAHADVFFSADLQWMDYLDKRGRLNTGT